MKRYKWYFFIFPVVFLFLSAVILIEGATPGNSSSKQSKLFATLFDNGSNTPTIIKPRELYLQGNTTLYLASQNTYTPKFVPENTSDKRVKYEILGNDDNLVSIDNNVLTGLREGTITLKVTSTYDSSLSDSLAIEIKKEPLTSLEASLSSENTLIQKMTSRLTVKGNTKDFSLNDVTFSSSDNDVATIDEEGYIRAQSIGTAKLLATSKYDSNVKSKPIELSVIAGDYHKATSLDYDDDVTLYIGENKKIAPTFNSDASDQAFRLKSEDIGLDIHEDTISSTKEGVYSLVLSSLAEPSLIKTVHVTVREVLAKSIEVSLNSIQYGKSTKVNYKLIPEIEGLNVTDPQVSFSSSDTSIATIDERGYLFGLKKGEVNITITWKKDTSISGLATIAITAMDGAKFDNINYWVRKIIGHFGSFLVTAVFGILTCYFFFFQGKWKYISSGIVLLWGIFLAVISEVFQIFAGQRGPSPIDSLIDFSGYLLGAVITFLILMLILHSRKKKQEKVKAA